jgi:hypothetical protein
LCVFELSKDAAKDVKDVASTDVRDVATTDVAGVATTDVAGVETTNVAGVATTNARDVATTDVAGVVTDAPLISSDVKAGRQSCGGCDLRRDTWRLDTHPRATVAHTQHPLKSLPLRV